jgi:hypothetical protein
MSSGGQLLLDLQLRLFGCRQAHSKNACYCGCNLAHIDHAQVTVLCHSLAEDEERRAHLGIKRPEAVAAPSAANRRSPAARR